MLALDPSLENALIEIPLPNHAESSTETTLPRNILPNTLTPLQNLENSLMDILLPKVARLMTVMRFATFKDWFTETEDPSRNVHLNESELPKNNSSKTEI
jgi:hypothetical protein